ncbi:MAG: PAS domain-containing protein, partial [Acidimicrobiia bacterium]
MTAGPHDGSADAALSDALVLDALHRAVIVTDRAGSVVRWNNAADDLYGWTEDDVVGRPVLDVVRAIDQDRAGHLLSIMRSGESWQGDLTFERRDGSPLRVFVIDRPVIDEQGNVVGVVSVSEDVTERRLIEKRTEDLATHLALALDAGELGTWHWDMRSGETTWDAQLEHLFGLEPGAFDGTFDSYVSLLHPEDAPVVLATVQDAVAQKSAYTVDHRVVWPDGTVHWLQGKGRVIMDNHGQVVGTIGCVADVTKQAEMTIDREALVAYERVSRERLEFLGRINDALSIASTRREVMRNVTHAAVPRLGDWCAIFVLPEPDSMIPDVEVAHIDPAMVRYVAQLQKRFPYDPGATSGIPAVIRSGNAEFLPEIDEQVIAEADTTDEARDIVRVLALRSAIAVPLVKRGRVIGAMQFVNTESSRRYTSDDLALAHAVASRIASSLEYIRLND